MYQKHTVELIEHETEDEMVEEDFMAAEGLQSLKPALLVADVVILAVDTSL